MSGLAKIVASIVSVPVAFVKEVVEDVKILEQEKAARKMEVPPKLSPEEQQMIDAMRRNTKR